MSDFTPVMPKPEMKPVESSNISSIGFDDANNVLWVEFRGGKLYTYEGVTAELYAECDRLNPSFSVGKWINTQVKPNYPATRHNIDAARP